MKCLNNRRLLVVDDQEIIHFSFRTVFGGATSDLMAQRQAQEGYDVDYAISGESALEIIGRGVDGDEPHALAFVDMYMPHGWSGVETITKMWEISPDLQVVLCTAFTDYSWGQLAARPGKADQLLILKKPFDKIEVRQLARALTEKWRLSRQVHSHLTNLEDMVAARTSELARANAHLRGLNQELVAARDASEAANRAKTEFLSNVSHEIRTPMTSVLGYAEMLGEPDCPVAERQESIDTIRKNADYLLAIIDDLLDISKLEAGRLMIERKRFSPRELALEISSLLNVRAAEKKLKLSVEFRSVIPDTIESDPIRLRQVLLNLVGNAIKFTEIGDIRLTVAMLADHAGRGPHLSFDVTDTGIGIAAEQIPNLFECFNLGDGSSTRRHNGIGLGLAVSMRLARLLEGDISVKSAPGAGSTFRMVVPVPAAAEDASYAEGGESGRGQTECQPQGD